MARIVIVAGTDAGQKIAEVLNAAGHAVQRTQTLQEAQQADVAFVEGWLYAPHVMPVDVPVVLLAPSDALAAAIEAVRGGAYDLVRVPCTSDEIRFVAERALRWQKLSRENAELRRQLAERQEQAPITATTASALTAEAASDNGARVVAEESASSDVAAVARNLAGKPLADIEKQVILSTLEQFKGHRLRTAAALGIGVRTLGMKIKRWREEGEPIVGRQPRPPVHVDVS